MARKFNVTERTIDNWRNNYDLPHHRVGGRIVFIEREVEEWVKGRRGRRAILADG